MKPRLLPILLLIALQAGANEVLDNEVVARMVKGGLSADIIVLKIEQSEGRFDVSADRLIALKAAGLPDAVIKAMLLKAGSPGTAASPAVASPAVASPAVALAAAPSTVPPAEKPVEPVPTGCATLRYYTSGTGGWDWYPASVCVTSSSIAIDEQNIPLDLVVAHCSPRAPLLDFGGTSYRGVQEWWFTDGRELHKFRGKPEDIDRLISAVVHAHPASKHGSCGEKDIARLLPQT